MKYLKKKIVALISMALIFSLALTPVEPAFAKAKAPETAAETAVIYLGDTGEVLWQKDAGKKMQPASMTKLLTCLLAAENLDPDQVVEVTAEAAAMPPTTMHLQTGEKVTVEELMYGALLVSGNDASVALAIATAGSVEDFAAMMNERAKSLGCTSTNFVNPSGLPDKNHYTTAKDMAIIAKEALDNDLVRKIAGAAKHTVPKTNAYEAREMKNSNMFLAGDKKEIDGEVITVEKYKGVFGGKTGGLLDDYGTLAIGLDYDGMEIYCVIMGVGLKERFPEMKKVLDYSKTQISKYTVFEKGQDFGKVKLLGGKTNKVLAVAADNGYINLPEGASASLVTTKCVYSDSLTAPIKKGQKVGVVEIYIAGDLYRTIDLTADSKVEKGWFLSRFGITNMQTVVAGIVLALVAVFALTIAIMRAQNKRRLQQLRRKNWKKKLKNALSANKI